MIGIFRDPQSEHLLQTDTNVSMAVGCRC